MKKYVCIGTKKIEAEWLPRFYKIPHDECVIGTTLDAFQGCIVLAPLPKGTNYKQHLNILKIERLIYGNDVR